MRFEGDGRISRHGLPWTLAVVLAIAAFLAFTAGTRFGLGAAAIAVILLGTVAMVSLGKPTKPGYARRRIRAHAGGVEIDGALAMSREEIVAAHVGETESSGSVVYLQGRFLRRSLAVFVETEREAHALMDALHLGRGESLATFKALPPWAKHVRWLAVVLTTSPWLLLNFLRFLPPWVLGLIGLGYAVIVLPVVLPQRVEVGQDGVFLRWLGNRRFVPFAQIEDVTTTPFGIVLLLHGGKRFEIRLSYKDDAATIERRALFDRIEAGLARHRSALRADEETLLARGSRDVETWVREMVTLGAGEAAGYRAIAIPRERLWEIVESPSADPSAREGAAIALHAALDDDERLRLVALVHNTASPRLRVALDGLSRERDGARLRVALENAEQEIEEPLAESPRRAAHGGS
ncbi:MAG: hypothetical protein KF819_08240 [Labilithrix sp.]|nr:hypothetical protein [Labilithrix sp.]